jgi:RimJ/RimL family protein N-acetyltransferase
MLPIDTERLRLRRLHVRDAVAFAGYRSDPSVARYQSWSGMTLQEAYDFIDEQQHLALGQHDRWAQLAVAEKATDQLVGDVGLCIKSPGHTAEMGFTIAPAVQHRGYGAEAVRAAIDLLFRVSAVRTIEAVIDARNASAIALIGKLGMVLDRTEDAPFKGEICTEHHFVCRRDGANSRSKGGGQVDIDNNDREIDDRDCDVDNESLKLRTLDVDIENCASDFQ